MTTPTKTYTPDFIPKASGSDKTSEQLPTSQTILDIQQAGMTLEEIAETSTRLAEKNKTQAWDKNEKEIEKAAVTVRYRWLFLLILSLVATFAFTLAAELVKQTYHLLAWGLLIGAIVLTLLTARFLRLPTRGGGGRSFLVHHLFA